ncbi:MAG: hypothetical protein JSV19_05210 [Phycisphaerales bacterium]|nr:MAG: hypothetical protein JSV19_05210 [Phycisphaerales bacterium]
MKRSAIAITSLVPVLLLSGCGDGLELSLGGDAGVSLLPPGSFVVRGQMQEPEGVFESCRVFLADTGIRYHLFQDPDLDNDLFDAVTTPGAISRLEVQARPDLELTCHIGTIVEVRDVLELIPAPE